MKADYDKLSDNELVKLAREKDDVAEEELIMRYGFIVKRYARSMYLIGAETEDLIQEGTIGLFKAVRDYDESGGAAFSTFATMCVKRQIDSAIKNYNRNKHMPLNFYVSISGFDGDDSGNYDEDIQDRRVAANPEKAVLVKEKHEIMLERMKQELSPFELKVVKLYLEGRSHADIAGQLGKDVKSIDNALQRIRGKLSAKTR
jgi:RNA polymerase sporulation-specific sigma factor